MLWIELNISYHIILMKGELFFNSAIIIDLDANNAS